MSGAISGIGTKFYRWSSTSSQWNALAEVTALQGPGMTRDSIEVTSFDSVDGWREFIAGLRQGGTVNLTLNFLRATFDVLFDDFQVDTVQNYKIVLPDTVETSLEFLGFVMECPITAAVDDRVIIEAVIQVTGKPVLYDGSSGA